MLSLIGILLLAGTVTSDSGSHWIMTPDYIIPGMPFPISLQFIGAPSSSVTVQLDLLQDEHTPILSERRTVDSRKPSLVPLQIPADLNDTLTYTLLVQGIDGLYFYEETSMSCRHPAVTQESFHIYIQSDKAIYKPGQTVRFRTFGMFSNMTVYTGPLNITITDPKRNTIKRWLNAEEGQYGVIENYMVLDTEPMLGDWSINVNSRDFGTTEVKTVTIDKYVLPKFDVTIEMPPFVLTSDKDLTGTVKATYTYGKPVEGTVLIRADLDYPYKPWNSQKNEVMVETHLNMTGETDFVIPLTRIASEVDPNDYVPLVQKLAGYHVTIQASVTESINNITRNASDAVQFYKEPYIVEFSDNDVYFKNGLPFTAHIKLTQADGRPVLSTQKDVMMTTYYKFYDRNMNKTRAVSLPEKTFTAPLSGFLDITIDTPLDASSIHLEVHYKSFTSTLNILSLTSGPPSSPSIQLSMTSAVAAIGREVHFTILSTATIHELTFMVVNHGLVMQSGTVSSSNGTMDIVFDVTSMMAPYSQLIVYYMDGTQWNADSMYFNTNNDAGIFKNQVTLNFNETSAEPGTSVTLNISTSPHSLVNVLAVDQSLVLLAGSGNDITQNDVVSSMKTDAAPATSGSSYQYQSLHSPATILQQTNGIKHLTDVGRISNRNYRSECPPGITYLPNAIGTPAPGQTYAPFVYPTWVPGMVPTPAPGFTYAPGVYPTAVPIGGLQQVTTVRKFFPETWLWTNVSAGADGYVSITTVVPDTITSWVSSAFSVSPTSGLGIAATHANLKTFRPFFVSLKLPYSVIRGEELVLQANVFNYMRHDQNVVVTLEKSSKFKVITPVRGQPSSPMNYVSEEVIRHVQVGAGKVVSVYIPILPEHIGKMDITVKAQSVLAADAVRRQLLVESEGVLLEENIPVLVAAGEEIAVPVVFPQNVVNGSQNIRVSVMGDAMGTVLKNMGSLLSLPTGCGEQTMTKLAPDVFLANYLSATGQLTDNIKETAIAYMERGYQRELGFQHYDGSFSIWGPSDYQGSMWLTAFVVKSFQQARKYIYVSDDVLDKSLRWITRYVNHDGSVQSIGSVHDTMLKGHTTGTASLSAFVLIALTEDGYQQPWVQLSAAKIRYYLEHLLFQVDSMSLYERAIISYALAKAGSGHAAQFFEKMDIFKQEKSGLVHWSQQPMAPNFGPMHWYDYYHKSDSYDTEVAAYALLYYIEKKDLAHGLPVLKWLLTQRNEFGGFISTQDTVLALQALSEYQSIFSGPLDLDLDVTAGTNFSHHFHIRRSDSLVMKTTTIQRSSLSASSNKATNVTLRAVGHGTVQAQVSVAFHVEQEVTNPTFNVTTSIEGETVRSLNLKTCFSPLQHYAPGMTVLEIGVPSGFEVEVNTLSVQPIQQKKLETKSRSIVLYFDVVPGDDWTVCTDIQMIRTELVSKSKPAAVRVFDYYKPSSRGLAFYESQLLKSTSVCDICNDCQC